MDERSLKAVLLLVFLNALILVVSGGRFCNPTPPLCADDCNGNGYYLNEGGTECIQCPTCPAGQELNKACGNGMNGDADGEAVCRPCPDGFFSTSTSRHCSPCTTCINTVELKACQVTQDRECGDCLPGFARSSDRFSADRNACPEPIAVEPLEPAPVDQPVPVEPLDALDACEPQPPRCIDPCYDGNYFVGNDGLCKACLQCQPGEQLNKVCGRGRNGDVYCQQCPEGTFSEYGIGRCTPCRICVNTVATECTATTDSVCGECLPGYYQDADGFFPDKGACPNKCMCPTTIPQCQEWCETEAEEVTKSATQPSEQDDAVSPQAVPDLKDDASGQNTVLPPAEADFPNVADKEVNVAAGSTSANHASYTTIFIVLVSLLAVIIVILIIVLGVFRHFWKKTSSNVSITAETTLLPDQRTSPGSSPGGSPPAIYNPTTSPVPSNENPWEFINYLSTLFPNINGERPPSGSSSEGENRSSAASTPTMNLNRRLADRDLRRHALQRQTGMDPNDSLRCNPQYQPPNPQSCTGPSLVNSAGNMNRSSPSRLIQLEVPKPLALEPTPNERSGYTEHKSSPRASSSHKVVTEKESGTVHQHVDDQNEVNGRHVRRRSSIISIVNEDDQVGSLHKDPRPQGRLGRRRYSMPCLPLSDGINMQRNVSNGNTSLLREPEAVLFPPDSSSDDGRTTNVLPDTNNKKTTNQKHQRQPSGPVTSSHPTATGAGVTIAHRPLNNVPEKCPNETTSLVDVGNSGTRPKPSRMNRNNNSSPPGEPRFTININMTTKDIENLHVGDVHSSHTFPLQTTTVSENDDEDEEDEAERPLNLTTSENDKIPEPNNHTCSDEDDDEDEAEGLLNMTHNMTKDIEKFHVGDVHSSHTYLHQTTTGSENQDEDDDEDECERLLNITTSENDTIPELHVHTCSDEDDEKDDEEDELLAPEQS